MPADREAACLRLADLEISWRELDVGVGRIATLLASLGPEPGARLLGQVEKSPEALMLYLAALRAGMVYVPLNTAYQEAELRHFVNDAQPAVVVCSPKRLAMFEALEPVAKIFSLDEHGQGTITREAAFFDGEFPTVFCDAHQPA